MDVANGRSLQHAGGVIPRCCALLTVLVVAAGCRALPAGAGPSVDAAPRVREEAPAACGFAPGTALEFAGRSTTAELDVQEAVGDSMSTLPADIYITRDAFEQGEHHGRLVCAIFVDQPDFVEITVHPEDGGRVEPVEPTPRPTPPPDGIAEANAVEAATGEVPENEAWELWGAFPATIAELPLTPDSAPWSVDLPADHWVWFVQYAREDVMLEVFVDYLDGSVLGTQQGIFN
jgi:hypothetical protein